MAARRVDRFSGQVYTETVSTPASTFTNGPAWIHETPFLPVGWEEGCDFGAPPLMHLAMKKVLSDQRNLTSVLFANVPWRVADYLWNCLGRSKKQTLHMWKLFATAYPVEFREVARYHSMKIEGPKASMREYLGLVKSDSMSWRVVLTLGASYARIPELVGISDIKNLVALEIATPAQPKEAISDETIPMTVLDDRILRTWAELSQTSRAFSHLGVLILHHHTDLSVTALHHLSALPSLKYVVTFKCPGINSVFDGEGQEEVAGWVRVDSQQYPPESLYEFYTMAIVASNNNKPMMPAESPILDFQVGQKMNLTFREKTSRTTSHSAIYLQRTNASAQVVDPQSSSKKRKNARAGPEDERRSEAASGPRKAVMRVRPTKDLGDVLKDFF